ncbi:unnamed protein product [Heligmosomoides polygyrus]|uniref:Secreted protein n=1 Tax=Heligmosomoides polygyrus TaxID=6339 RepID=A0A3P7YC13_HELPZ|nr:unnamed protein product [Heligmosomoides polygyrus]
MAEAWRERSCRERAVWRVGGWCGGDDGGDEETSPVVVVVVVVKIVVVFVVVSSFPRALQSRGARRDRRRLDSFVESSRDETRREDDDLSVVDCVVAPLPLPAVSPSDDDDDVNRSSGSGSYDLFLDDGDDDDDDDMEMLRLPLFARASELLPFRTSDEALFFLDDTAIYKAETTGRLGCGMELGPR